MISSFPMCLPVYKQRSSGRDELGILSLTIQLRNQPSCLEYKSLSSWDILDLLPAPDDFLHWETGLISNQQLIKSPGSNHKATRARCTWTISQLKFNSKFTYKLRTQQSPPLPNIMPPHLPTVWRCCGGCHSLIQRLNSILLRIHLSPTSVWSSSKHGVW